jgi:hypothetical protein
MEDMMFTMDLINILWLKYVDLIIILSNIDRILIL